MLSGRPSAYRSVGRRYSAPIESERAPIYRSAAGPCFATDWPASLWSVHFGDRSLADPFTIGVLPSLIWDVER